MNQNKEPLNFSHEYINNLVENEVEKQFFVYISDVETYELLYINSNIQKQFNLKDWKVKKCYEVFHNRSSKCSFCNNNQLNENKFYIWKYTNNYLNRTFLIKDKIINCNGRRLRLEIATDIIGKENSNIKIKRKLHKEKTLINCIKVLMGEKYDLDDGINKVLKIIGRFYNADRVYMFKLDTDKSTCSNTHEWCNNGVKSEILNLQNIDIDKYKIWYKAFKEGKNIIIHNVNDIKESCPKEYNMMNQNNILSMIAVPCMYKNTFTGFIGLDNPKSRDFDTEILVSISFFIINEVSKHNLRMELEYMSYYDDLTGVLNRKRYGKYLKEYDDEALKSIGVSVVDINGLKIINENYGHSCGNRYIKKTADILNSIFILCDIFRLNADEFVIIDTNVEFDAFMEKVNAVKELFKKEENYSVSVGFCWSDYEKGISKLIHQAEDSMFIEKQKYYQNNTDKNIHHKPFVLGSLLKAIDDKIFFIYLQPKINVETKEISGAEALVRAYSADRKSIIPPGKFIDFLEHERVIKYVDLFVFEEVCKLLSIWKKNKVKQILISLNFSRLTLMESNLLTELKQIVSKYDCDIEYIEIEITESLGDIEIEHMRQVVEQLKKAGFKISLDDFGSRYTNTSILSAFDFDTLKLDRSLINNICCNEKSRIVVQSIIDLCRRLNIEVIAEGVETEIQANVLNDMHCVQIQGYYFSKPLEVSLFESKYMYT